MIVWLAINFSAAERQTAVASAVCDPLAHGVSCALFPSVMGGKRHAFCHHRGDRRSASFFFNSSFSPDVATRRTNASPCAQRRWRRMLYEMENYPTAHKIVHRPARGLCEGYGETYPMSKPFSALSRQVRRPSTGGE